MNMHSAQRASSAGEPERGLRPIGEILQVSIASWRHEARFPLVRVTSDDYLVLYDREPTGDVISEYAIALSDLRSAARVAFWFRQLALKRWVTPKHLERMAHEIYRLNGGTD
jgi:hypothetical protein